MNIFKRIIKIRERFKKVKGLMQFLRRFKGLMQLQNRFMKILTRLFDRPQWKNLRSTRPVSSINGFDRGTPIDRVYIEDFLEKNRAVITGIVCEVDDATYSKIYGNNIIKYEILDVSNNNPQATIVADLSKIELLPHNKIDCFICTQTLHLIYDFKAAINGIYAMLKVGGIVLATVPGISQICRDDLQRWGDYWRFTVLSIQKAFEEIFGKGNVDVDFYGNVLSSIAFLEGIAVEELTREELFFKDADYQMIIVVKAIKQKNT
ncbi:MAG: methyltransferase domain-containing protein [Bacteroidota bacterium]